MRILLTRRKENFYGESCAKSLTSLKYAVNVARFDYPRLRVDLMSFSRISVRDILQWFARARLRLEGLP